MQLLKLVYIAHGWCLGLNDRPLISDEVQAWQYGPVIPTLYKALRGYKNNAVTERLPTSVGQSLSPKDSSLLEQVYDLYGHKTGSALSTITHAPNSPWAALYEPGKFGIRIPNERIRSYYRRLLEESEAAQNAYEAA